MRDFISVLVMALALLPSVANAQEPPSISPGTRVRVWQSPTAESLTGKVLKLDATTMTLSVEGVANPITVTRNSTARIDVSRGRHTTGKSVLRGTLIGTGIGVILGLTSGGAKYWSQNDTAADKAALLSILTAPIGLIVGAIAGEERWTTTTPTSAKLPQTIAVPTPSLRFTFRF